MVLLERQQNAVIAELGQKSADWAAEALLVDRNDAAAHFYRAAGLSLAALGRSKVEALVEGYPTRIRRHIDRAIELDRGYVDALFLKGKYLTLAPWPFRSRDRAERILLRANDLALRPDGQLLLGDLYHLMGKKNDAKSAWVRALNLAPEQNAPVARLARRRLAHQVRH